MTFLLDDLGAKKDFWFIKDPMGLNGRGLNATNDIDHFRKEYYLTKLSP